MGIPEEINAVARPENTIVDDLGVDGPQRWAVRTKPKFKLVEGCPLCIGGRKILGYIVDGEYRTVASMPCMPVAKVG